MAIQTQKRLLSVLVSVVIVAPLIWAMSALGSHTVSALENITIGIIAVEASLAVAGVFILLYLGRPEGPATPPVHWEPERRKPLFVLMLFVSGVIFLSMLGAFLFAWNRLNIEVTTAVAAADGLIMVGLLVIAELFVLLNMFWQRNVITDATSG